MRRDHSLEKPQNLYIIIPERSNHIVLTAILEGEAVKIIIDLGANRVYVLTGLVRRLRQY
jgi:hypothetical protein